MASKLEEGGKIDIFTRVIGILLVLILIIAVGWMAYEKHVNNQILWITPEDRQKEVDRSYNREVGALSVKFEETEKKIDRLIELEKTMSELKGKFVQLEDFIKLISPEEYEKRLAVMSGELTTAKQHWDVVYKQTFDGLLKKQDLGFSNWDFETLQRSVQTHEAKLTELSNLESQIEEINKKLVEQEMSSSQIPQEKPPEPVEEIP